MCWAISSGKQACTFSMSQVSVSVAIRSRTLASTDKWVGANGTKNLGVVGIHLPPQMRTESPFPMTHLSPADKNSCALNSDRQAKLGLSLLPPLGS
ncbi:unnamed protein product [Linum trigynum]|uniref:Uncharacterized protein n=1 Tax=Linum trigynum TaxID=586398 RepID=A0AAV2GQH1_9ROSI